MRFTNYKNHQIQKMKKVTELKDIGLEKIFPSPRNPRKTVSETELDELAQNIKNQGLLQPITVRPVGDAYEIVCGERRYRAVRKNAESNMKATIACIVKEMSDEEAFEAMITENLQRKDVDPMEEAFAFCELVKAGRTVDEIAERFGKNKRFIQERLKLNSLITPLKTFTTKGVLPIAGAMMLSKLKKELQNTFFEYLEERYERDEGLVIEVKEIRSWIQREFMRLDTAKFLEYDEDDEEALPTEDWNKGQFEKCATCCMNTGNADCLFYQIKGDHYCTDRECFEKKIAAFSFYEIERLGEGRFAMEGQKLNQDYVVILDDDPDVKQGYDSMKRIRKSLLDMIREKGYKIVPSASFDNGRCKYYHDDERIPKLLKQGKVVECVSLGSPYNINIEKVYFYTPSCKDEEPEEFEASAEARKLADKYRSEREKTLANLDNRLRDWSVYTYGKDYSRRTDELTIEEEHLFWALILADCSKELREEISGSVIVRGEDVVQYVRQNFSGENKRRWLRDYINETCRRRSSYESASRIVMRMLYQYEYPDDFRKLFGKLSDTFEKRTAKIKARLQELGYGANGEKV